MFGNISPVMKSLQQQQQNRAGTVNPSMAPTADPLRNNSVTLGKPYQYTGGTPLQDVAQGFNVQNPQMNQNNGIGLSAAADNTGMMSQAPLSMSFQNPQPMGQPGGRGNIQQWMQHHLQRFQVRQPKQPQQPVPQQPQSPWAMPGMPPATGFPMPNFPKMPGRADGAPINPSGPFVGPPIDWTKGTTSPVAKGGFDWSQIGAAVMPKQEYLTGWMQRPYTQGGGLSQLAQQMRT